MYWNKRKRLHDKIVSSHRVRLEHQYDRRLLVAVLENQYGGHDVITKRSIVAPFL